jgi:alanyl-tRNA synthetase
MKVYYDNPYLKEIETKVIAIDDRKVVLEKTIFYPQSAGEPGDTGLINNDRVIDTQLINEKITHILESIPTFKVGDTVKATLDWDRRYKLMKMHTALHLLFNVCQEIIGKNIKPVGSNVGEEKSRIDIYLEGSITQELREKIEKKCNEIISENKEVKIWWDSERPNFRWTQIDGLTKLPCGGLHVRSTKEIGTLRIIKRDRIGKNKDRLEITVE